PSLAHAPRPVGEPVLDVQGWGVELVVRAGEVVAVAGVAGNGQTLLAEAITGHVADHPGAVRVLGRDARGTGARRLADLGVAYIPEDGREVGLVGGQSVAVNLALRGFDGPPFSRGGWVDQVAIHRNAVALIARYGIRPPDPELPVARLSGGNQQR